MACIGAVAEFTVMVAEFIGADFTIARAGIGAGVGTNTDADVKD